MQYGSTDNPNDTISLVENTSSNETDNSNVSFTDFNTVPFHPSRNTTPRWKLLQRQESVILAETGERVRRSLSYTSDTEGENEPLLGNSWGPLSTIHKLYSNDIFRNVLKCSITYFIASLGVYWTPFNNFLGKTDSKHIVATVVVYFHPSRSKGSMHQSLIFVCISLIFSVTVSFGCRSISAYFFKIGQDEVSYSIDLVASSIALGVIAFVKQKVNKQTFNTACSLASISIVSCIVKEGSLNSSNIPFERLKSTFQVVVIGCLITMVICYVIWPISAVKQLEKHLDDSYNIMSSVLVVVTKRFLCGEKFNSKDELIFDQLKSNIKKLYSSLEEAHFELKLKGKEASLVAYEQLVESTASLSKHLQALRSSTEMQWKLLHDYPQETNNLTTITSNIYSNSYRENIDTESTLILPEIDSALEDSVLSTSKNSEQLFNLFVYYLAPSIKSIIFTIKEVLSKVPFELGDDRLEISKHLQSSLFQASELFNKKQSEAFELLYSQSVFNENKDLLFKTNQEEVTACCGNFSSLLGLFAVELIDFLRSLDSFEKAKYCRRNWSFLKIRKHEKDRIDNDQTSFSNVLSTLQSRYNSNKYYEHNNWKYKMWKFLTVFKRTDVQFGIRVGLGAFFLSSFAFFPYTRDTFISWRGEWSLTIYCIMNNKSLGGTSMTVKWRLIGTFLGAFTAYVVWILTDGNVYALALTGFLISIPSFYIIIYWKANNPFGRFILLTYNLTALYSYSMTQRDGEDGNEGGENPIIGEIAFHRFIAVSIGIVWALLMSSLFLQNSARTRLKKGLTILWLRLGISWSTDLLEYDEATGELVGIKDEKGMDYLLAECETLLKQAPMEIRMKGKFPISTYTSILKGTSSIIDSIQNLKLMIKLDPSLSPNEKYVLQYIEAERKEVEYRIFLMFYMVASAMTLHFPLPDVLTSTEHAKSRMLIKLNEIRLQETSTIKLKNEDYVLLYSYILVINEVSDQLNIIVSMVKDLLGDLSEDIFELV